MSQARRVVIVDNDPVTRGGLSAILDGFSEIELVRSVDHDTALSFTEEWDAIDVAIVDASDSRRREGDQFPGVAVVQSARTRRAPGDLTLVVLTGQALHQGLQRRMWEAGADFFYPRDEGMTESELAGVVLRPEEKRRMDTMPVELPGELGVGPRTTVNKVLARLDSPEAREALKHGGAKKSDPHGPRSRWWDHLRELAGGPGGLTPRKASGDLALDQDKPSIVQLRKFWEAMTQVAEGRRDR